MEEYVDFELGMLLKEAGFDEDCFLAYVKFPREIKVVNYTYTPNNSDLKDLWGNKKFCSAPTHQSVLNWLFREHGIFVSVNVNVVDHSTLYMGDNHYYFRVYKNRRQILKEEEPKMFRTPQEAVSSAIDRIVRNIGSL